MTATARSSRPGRPIDPDALADLEEQRDFLLRSLEDLDREREAGDIDDDDYRTLHDDYTARAAAVLRAIDEGRASLAAPRPARRSRTVLVVLAVGAVGVAAGLAVAAASGTRLPGQFASGQTDRATSSQKIQAAAALAERGEVLAAIEEYDEVLAEDPDNAAALTYKGWLLVDVGDSNGQPDLVARGTGYLRDAVAADPRFPDAHFFLGFVLLRLEGDRAGAEREFQAVLDNDPPRALAQQARMVLGDLRAGGDGIPDNPVPAPSTSTTAPGG